MQLTGTTHATVNVPDKKILEAAVTLVLANAKLNEDHCLSENKVTLMEYIDWGHHRGGLERKPIRPATEADVAALSTVAYLKDLIRRL